ncbi:MAG TPA: YjfB family protein [Candidatus Caccousia stercoris]|uniref:YjfB family protein n=1 Tax=Candidatus Caccousia stercoris TaxID=2840723 RepID=A0A9D1FSZ3_9FIRM|nr:YjfB family protein [Candidatus Caccousia stercoris]
MGMMDSIAATSTALSAAQFQQDYSLSLMKKAMNTQELAAQQMLQMLPQTPPLAEGTHIDVYA